MRRFKVSISAELKDGTVQTSERSFEAEGFVEALAEAMLDKPGTVFAVAIVDAELCTMDADVVSRQ